MPALRRQNSWFVTVPISAAAIAFLSLIFFPTAKAIREKLSDLRRKQEYIAQCEKLTSQIAKAEQDLEFAEQFTAGWRNRMASQNQLAELFGKITEHARLCGVTTGRFDPQQEAAMESLHRIPIQMELGGSYCDICRLIAAIEGLPENVWIEQLKFEKSGEAGKDMKCEIKLEVFAVHSEKSG